MPLFVSSAIDCRSVQVCPLARREPPKWKSASENKWRDSTACLFLCVSPCRTFAIIAAAQLCVLSTTWVFECFQFVEGTTAMSYLFTIFGSLQGVMLFIMHCLFCKQVSHASFKTKEHALLLFLDKTNSFVFDFR